MKTNTESYIEELKERIARATLTLNNPDASARQRTQAAQLIADSEYVLKERYGIVPKYSEIQEIAERLK